MQGAAQPRYKQFRPPALHIHQPQLVPVTSPPTHIDIDWNILVKTVNEGIPNTDETKEGKEHADLLPNTAQFRDRHVTTDTQRQSPDWASPTALTSATEKQKNESDPHSSTLLAVKDDNYLLEIARNKCLFIFDEAEATNKSMELRKNLLDEIDRVSLLLQQPPPHQNSTSGAGPIADAEQKKMLEEKKSAYESYRTELRIELEKWNRASYEFRNHNNLPGEFGNDGRNAMKEAAPLKNADNKILSHQVENEMVIRTGRTGRDDSKEKPLLPKTNDISNQFPDTRKQLRFVKVMAPSTLPAVSDFRLFVPFNITILTRCECHTCCNFYRVFSLKLGLGMSTLWRLCLQVVLQRVRCFQLSWATPAANNVGHGSSEIWTPHHPDGGTNYSIVFDTVYAMTFCAIPFFVRRLHYLKPWLEFSCRILAILLPQSSRGQALVGIFCFTCC